MPGSTSVLRIAVPSPTGRMTFLLRLTLARANMKDLSPLRRWRTPRHYCRSSCSYMMSLALWPPPSRQWIFSDYTPHQQAVSISSLLSHTYSKHHHQCHHCDQCPCPPLRSTATFPTCSTGARMGLSVTDILLQEVAGILIVLQAADDDTNCPLTVLLIYPGDCYLMNTPLLIINSCITLQLYQHYCGQGETLFLWTLLSIAFQSIGYQFAFMTALEFICAQTLLMQNERTLFCYQ